MDTVQSGGVMLQIIPEIKNNLESLDHLSVLTETLSTKELFDLPFRRVFIKTICPRRGKSIWTA